MTETVEKKLKQLPDSAGVYFHKDKDGKIIYVGKAAVLKNRVRQYFQQSRGRDPKTEALVADIADVEWMTVDSEMEALFLEAEMIRRYMPRYNILLRDDKAMSYIRIDVDSDYPTVSTTRRPLDDRARYFGPYTSTTGVRAALKMLRKVFPFATRQVGGQKRATLHYHLGLDPGLEEGKTTLEDYRANLRKLMSVIEGRRKSIEKEMETDMHRAAKQQRFEDAAKLRNRLKILQNLHRQIVFSDKEFMDISKDHALNELVELLNLSDFPRRIEGYDISHMQGTDVVASCVVFTNGVSDKSEYRKFKTKINHNNDFYNMHETLTRRLSEKNVKAWGKPSLVLIDGGKGQLDAATRARNEQGAAVGLKQELIPFVGLAKREEQIVIKKGFSNVEVNYEALHKLGGFATESEDFILLNVPHNTSLVKLLQRIRDESHRFAITYHGLLKGKRQTSSMIDDIPGFGPATRKKLIKHFGSLRAVKDASNQELADCLGAKKAAVLRQHLGPSQSEVKAAVDSSDATVTA